MIKFFRQSYAIQYVVIALLAIALWIPAFASGKVLSNLEQPVTPIFNLVNGIVDFSSFAQLLFAFFLLVFETLIINAVLVNNQIVGKVSTMGAFVFVLMMSLTTTQTNFYPFALSSLFILLVIKNLFEAYQHSNPEINLVKVGGFLALASMCYFPAIVLVLWVMIVLPMAKNGSLRLQFVPLFGFLFVYFVYFLGVFFFGDLKSLMQSYVDYFNSINFTVKGFNLKIIILLVVLVASSLLLMFGGSDANFEKTIAVRSKISMTFVMLVFAVFLLFIDGNVLMNGLIFIVLSILISYSFSYISNTGWANLFLVFFLIAVFANHYYFKLI